MHEHRRVVGCQAICVSCGALSSLAVLCVFELCALLSTLRTYLNRPEDRSHVRRGMRLVTSMRLGSPSTGVRWPLLSCRWAPWRRRPFSSLTTASSRYRGRQQRTLWRPAAVDPVAAGRLSVARETRRLATAPRRTADAPCWLLCCRSSSWTWCFGPCWPRRSRAGPLRAPACPCASAPRRGLGVSRRVLHGAGVAQGFSLPADLDTLSFHGLVERE